MTIDKKIRKDFYIRPIEEQEWLLENTWCESCKKADTGIENPTEFEINGILYISGFCKSCDTELISEIKDQQI